MICLPNHVLRPPQRPEKGEALRSACMPLMGGKHMLSIFAMLLHRWVFHPKHQGKQGDERGDVAERVQMTKHVYVLLSGAQPDTAMAVSTTLLCCLWTTCIFTVTVAAGVTGSHGTSARWLQV